MCTKFEHTLRVCIAVLSFLGEADLGCFVSDTECIFVDVERQRNSAPRMMLIFFYCTTKTGSGQVGSMGQKS